jgi:hypothetical protein
MSGSCSQAYRHIVIEVELAVACRCLAVYLRAETLRRPLAQGGLLMFGDTHFYLIELEHKGLLYTYSITSVGLYLHPVVLVTLVVTQKVEEESTDGPSRWTP